MQESRRTVLQTGSAFLALLSGGVGGASPAKAQMKNIRRPLEEFSKDPKQVASLRRGVSVMKSRKPSDPTSWFFQGAIHAVLGNEVVKAAQADSGMAQVDVDRFWNKCPHFGENAANFLLWHRAYLYYFERILRDAAQDPDLSLPYWNYTDAAEAGTPNSKRLLPKIFLGSLVGGPGSEANTLFHGFRDPDANRELSELSFKAVDTSRAFGSDVFFGATESDGFCGGMVPTEADANTSGLIERSPHNLVHLFAGDVSAPTGAQGMANVPEAAFDPIFWVHHANIDRLWVDYVGMAGKSWGTVPETSWFAEKPWAFYDFDRQVKTETRGYWMDHRKLDYGYPNEPPPRLNWPPPSVSAATAKSRTPFRAAAELFRSGEAFTLSKSTSTAVEIIGDKRRSILGVASKAVVAQPLANATDRRVILQLLNPKVDVLPATGFEVFVMHQPVGVFAPFGWNHHHRHAQTADSGPQFDITDALATMALSGGPIRIEVRPFAVSSFLPGAAQKSEKRTSDGGKIAFSGTRIFAVER